MLSSRPVATPESLRTFVAVKIGEGVRRNVKRTMESLRTELPQFRWTDMERLHLTLAFLGDVPAIRTPDLSKVIEEAAKRIPPFDVEWKALGCFPSDSRASILWMGAKTGTDELAALNRAVVEAIAGLGIQFDSRFTPHVTLARVNRSKRRPPDLRSLVARFRGVGFGVDHVDKVELMRSDLRPAGSIYTSLAVVPLAGE